MKQIELMFATANAGKVREVQEICGILGPVYGVDVRVDPMPDRVDIPETGSTYEENACQKAQYVWKRYGVPCIADDSGLEVDAMGGGPGIHTARFCGHDFVSGIDMLLAELSRRGATGSVQRRASFECRLCVIGLWDGSPRYFSGSCHGAIATQRRGTGGFGFDPVFLPDEAAGLCMAELPEREKNRISHRARAMDAFFSALSPASTE